MFVSPRSAGGERFDAEPPVFTPPTPFAATLVLFAGASDVQHATAAKRRDRFDDEAVVAALLADGDSRVAVDRLTGTNKYLCPPRPLPGASCFSSCTASPIDPRGFARAAELFNLIQGALSPGARAGRIAAQARHVETRLLHHFGVAGLARVSLHPSGTDAMLAVSLLLAASGRGEKITAILPAAGETGSGVGLAATSRRFDGPQSGTPLAAIAADAVEIPLRSAAGEPLPAETVDAAFHAAAKSAAGRPVLILTHGSKTGLIAPVTPPRDAEVIVDACQARIAPATLAAYLKRGWPVVVTGSKFFGGPAFSGAVLLPNGRTWQDTRPAFVGLGTVLRWTAALDAIEAFAPHQAAMDTLQLRWSAAVARGFADNPAIVPIGGLEANGPGWAERPTIFTFALRDPADPSRLLPMAALQTIYRRLAGEGFLLGQPVSLGSFGGLRIALGARDLSGDPLSRLENVFQVLKRKNK